MGEATRIVFGGDTAYGESYQAAYAAAGGRDILAERGYAHCTERLAPLLRRADHVVLNLETPLSDRRETAIEGKAYVHWADPEKSAAALRDLGVDAVSLANNHAVDLGRPGLDDTFEVLARSGIAGFGAGADAAGAARAHAVEFDVDGAPLSVAVVGGYARSPKFEAYGLYAGDGEAGIADLGAAAAEIARVRAAAPRTLVVAFPHWGKNYAGRDIGQIQAADALFEAGADVILGHGAHRLQEVERRNGRWAVFSLGNFVFNSGGRYAKMRSTPLSLVAEIGADRRGADIELTLRLYPIFSDNRITDFQPRLVDEAEFTMLLNALKQLVKLENGAGEMSGARDDIGWHVRLPLGTRAA